MTFTLPEPPSANRWWRKFNNRMVLSPEARAYKTKIAVLLHGKVHPRKGPVVLTLAWYRGRKSGDLDKRVGICLDALQGVAYDNDSQIVELHASRFEDKANPRLEVTVSGQLVPIWPGRRVGWTVEENGCWQWHGATGPRDGYGRVAMPKTRNQAGGPLMGQAHRVVFERAKGPIPPGLDLDHLCRNRGCVNPEHLEPVTRGENVLRGIGLTARHARATHCPAGHPYDLQNTYRYPATRHRGCRRCISEYRRTHREARAAYDLARATILR